MEFIGFDVVLSLTELLEVANDRGLVDWEHQPTRNATMEDIDLEKVKAYLALLCPAARFSYQ